jgi:enediyne biosynthesis protein E4
MKFQGTRVRPLIISLTVSTLLAGLGCDGCIDEGNVDAGIELDAGSHESYCSPRETVVPAENFFSDMSAAAGIQEGTWDPNPTVSIPINDHSRLGFVDLDGDGFDDIVTHSLFPNPQAGIPFEHIIFRNLGDGTFEDFSDASGLRDIQAGFFAFGDVDNDGDQDCFAGHDAQLPGSENQILMNNGQGVFRPVAQSGLESSLTIAANAVFADFDGDAILDLFIGYGHTSYAAADQLYWGYGDGSFTLGTQALAGGPAHPTNGSVACDYDDDGDLDIFVSTYGVSHELGANILWENNGDQTFTNVAVERGFASLAGGNFWLGLEETPEPDRGPGTYVGSNGFGLDCGDVNGDGFLDIFLTTISHPVSSDYLRKWSDPTQVLINQGPDGDYAFVNESQTRGVPFNEGDVDGALMDFDLDGRLDLSISRDKKYEGNYTTEDQKAWFGLMHQKEDGSFASVGPASGINDLDAVIDASLTDCTSDADCTDPAEACLRDRCRTPCSSDAECTSPDEMCHSGGFCKLLLHMKNAQNHAWSDVDHDGDLDLLVGGRDTGGGRPNFLFRNEIGSENRWLSLRLVGDGTNINRDAIGARVSLVFADRTVSRELHASRGMHNSLDTRILHFGLGDFGCDYTMEVRWPDGTEVSFKPTDYPEETQLTLEYPDQLSF